MGFLDRIAARWGYAKTTPPENAPPWMLRVADAERWSLPDAQTAQAQGELYLRLSWIQTAISAVARVGSTSPFGVKIVEGEKLTDVANHPFEMLLRRPNPMQSRSELLIATLSYMLATGNWFWWLNRRNAASPPSEIWAIPTQQIMPVPDGRMFLKGYLYDPDDGGRKVPLEPWEVVHGKLFNPSSWFMGASPLQALNTVARGDLAMQKWNANYFGRDNAKIPGALAFADPINESAWERLREEVRRDFGGANRSGPMMMRNVGAGGVEWIQMALSHSDMEFLDGRRFTKEEIYGVFAPGLSSVLDVNATEANSKAGKDTFRELAVWPLLVGISEKITNDILPAYGPEFMGEFDDVRVRDRAMELAEQNAAAQVQTVDELRATYYDLQPIGDERGALLVAQITAQSGGIQEPPPAPFAAGGLPSIEPEPRDADDADGALEDAQGETDESEREEEAAKRERRAFKRWLKRKPGRDVHDFQALYLSDGELHALAGGAQHGEMGAPFRAAEWGHYP